MNQLASIGLLSLAAFAWKWLPKVHSSITFVEDMASSSRGVSANIIFDQPKPYSRMGCSGRMPIPFQFVRRGDNIHRITVKIISIDGTGINIDRILTRFEETLSKEFGPVRKGFDRILPETDEEAPEHGVIRNQNSRRRWVVSYWATGPISVDALRGSLADFTNIEDLSLKETRCSERSARHTKVWAAACVALFALLFASKALVQVAFLPLLWANAGVYIFGMAWLDFLYLHECSIKVRTRVA